MGNTGDFGRNGIHQHGRGIAGCAAGNIHSRPLDGSILLPQDEAPLFFQTEAVTQLIAVEKFYIFLSLPQGFQEIGINARFGFFDFLNTYPQTLQSGAIKLPAVGQNRFIPLFDDFVYNPPDNGFNIGIALDFPVEDILQPDFPIKYSNHSVIPFFSSAMM